MTTEHWLDRFERLENAQRRQRMRDLELSRRGLLKGLAAGAGALAGANLLGGGRFASAQTTPELPEMTSIPDRLKGTGEVRVVSWGGSFQAAQRRAYFEPFERLSGIKVIEFEGPDTAKVRAMVESKNVEWDVAQLGMGSVLNLERRGDYWEEIDYSYLDTENIDQSFRFKNAFEMLPFATIIAYRKDVYTSSRPAGWKDFWDADKFPGPRTIQAGQSGLTPFLEAALMADGVDMNQVYPIDIERAYNSLAKLKPHVAKWWTTGAMPIQMLTDKEVNMATAWNGRVSVLQEQGAPVDISWEQGTLASDIWCVPKGAPNKLNAMKFNGFITLAISQARLSMLIPYGFVNKKAAEYIPPDRLKELPTAPDIAGKLLKSDYYWWADNRDAVLDKWNEWILS